MTWMASPDPVRRRARGAPWAFLLGNGLILGALFVVGAVAVWPIYRTGWFVVAVGTSITIGAAIALLGTVRSLSGWWVALAAFAAYVVFGVPLAAPGALTGGESFLTALLGVITAPVTGWRNILTLELPLGTYQSALAPAVFLFIGIPAASLSLAWRAQRLWVLAPALAMLLTVFGVLFGSEALSSAARLGSWTLPAPAEFAVGIAGVLLWLGFVVWREKSARRRALRKAEQASGVRGSGRDVVVLAGRVALGIAMLAVAAVAGTLLTPLAVADSPRDVLRAHTDPRVEIQAQASPLAQYREFTGDEHYDEVLFTVRADADIERVRLATLTSFDGRVARVFDPAGTLGDSGGSFRRVPDVVAAPPGARAVSADIQIGGYTDVWVPLVGSLTAISFEGDDGETLADGFYYADTALMGVQLGAPGLTPGTSYRQGGAVVSSVPPVSSLTPSLGGPSLDSSIVPDSLTDWIAAQEAPEGGAGLQLLIDRLRARGYLSHSLTLTPDAPPRWMTELGDYAFVPSRPGHSTDRIDALFQSLNQRQADVGGTVDRALVSGVGDDEQFAVAAWMIADQLGFPARVAVGARLHEPADADRSRPSGVPACAQGACRGANITAWLEVQDISGEWVPIDVTPQHEVALVPDDEQRREPQNPTEVQQQHAEQVPPAQARPSDEDEPEPDHAAEPDEVEIWGTVRAVGIGLLLLLVLLTPMTTVLVYKAVRRGIRHRSPTAAERISGGWEEFVDAAVDRGYPAPATQTRQELARLYGRETDGHAGIGMTRLATAADRAAFDRHEPSDAEGDEFWLLVESERARLAAEATGWQRLGARLSVRSLVRRRDRR